MNAPPERATAHLLALVAAFAVPWTNPAFAQTESKVTPSVGNESAWFGAAVAIDGNRAIVGAPGDPNFIGNPGSALIYEREGSTWFERARLVKANGKEMDLFGHAVSISGETAVVGVPRDDLGFRIDDGSAFVYVLDGDVWTLQAQLTAGDAQDGDEFGYAVDVDGNTVVVSATEAVGHRGAVYVFERTGATWEQRVKLTAPGGVEGDEFGISVAISGDNIVVGAPERRRNGKGSAYVFRRTGAAWTHRATLRATDGVERDAFGVSVDIDRERVIVGAPWHDFENLGEYDEGTAYVFNSSGGQSAKLRIREGTEEFAGQFNVGTAVAISRDLSVLGAIGSGGPDGMTGAAYLFSGGTEQAKLLASDGTTEDFFGIAVAISEGCPLIGARRDDPHGFESGTAYIYCGAVVPARPVTVAVDLVIHKPKVIDPAEMAIPDPVELSRGAQVWVNLDNDDEDEAFDSYDADSVTGGDDKLSRLELRLDPPTLASGTVTLTATSGSQYIRVWQDAEKFVPLALPVSIDLANPASGMPQFAPEGGALVTKLWVEGTAPHTVQRATTFELTYEGGSTATCAPPCADEVALTILGVKAQTWLGRSNGFTPASTAHNSDTLRRDPNFPFDDLDLTRYPRSNRVFAGARAPNFNAPRDRVELEIELTVAPVENVDLFVRSFDIDDPSSETDYIDPNDLPTAAPERYFGTETKYTLEDDNRSDPLTLAKAGVFTGQDGNGIGRLTFTPSGPKQTAEFRTSLHPGDNYRAVANADRDFLVRLRNQDNQDGFRIVHRDVTGSADNREILEPAGPFGWPVYASGVLTVWRLLHVENDSMEPESGYEVTGNIVGLAPVEDPIPTSATVSNNLDDGSANLDTRPPSGVRTTSGGGVLYITTHTDFDVPPDTIVQSCEQQPLDFGRFQNGTLTVAGTTVIAGINGNGDDYVLRSAGINLTATPLPFSATDDAWFWNSTMAGTVTAIIRDDAEWLLQLNITTHSDPTLDWPDFDGGTISIGGGPAVSITSLATDSVIGVDALAIPYSLVDDDSVGMLPDDSDLSGLTAFHDAYVYAVDDGGGVNGNDHTVPFQLNVLAYTSTLTAVFDGNPRRRSSWNNETDGFWVVYVVSAYQSEACIADRNGNIRGDGDPNRENPIFGQTAPLGTVASDTLAKGGEGSLIFREAERDAIAAPGRRLDDTLHPLNVAHEVGHQFGLGHRQLGLMHGTMEDGRYFSVHSINLIRSRVSSPGRWPGR